MKIRGDFVTNSSSTSFVIITDEEFNRESFFEKIGINETSEMAILFENLYLAFERNQISLEDYLRENKISESDINSYFEENFSSEISNKISIGISEKKKIFIGKLSSDYDEFESFFCTDSFVIDDEIYINGANCVW